MAHAGTSRPGRTDKGLARWLRRVPDGAFLRIVFFGLIGLSIATLAYDYRDLIERDGGFETQYTTRDPVRLARPSTDDQVRPYLPFTRPSEEDGEEPARPKLPTTMPRRVESEPMRFERGPRGQVTAAGRIDPGTAERFARYLDQQEGEVRSISLHSPGGSVDDALKMARLIRERGINTSVPDDAYCASSCPLVFAGGAERSAGDKSWIGVHQIYALPNALGSLQQGMSAAQQISALCQQTLVDLGIDPALWIHAMQTPKDKIYFLTTDELTTYKLATSIGGETSHAHPATQSPDHNDSA